MSECEKEKERVSERKRKRESQTTQTQSQYQSANKFLFDLTISSSILFEIHFQIKFFLSRRRNTNHAKEVKGPFKKCVTLKGVGWVVNLMLNKIILRFKTLVFAVESKIGH